jgi:hypothetical protein
LQKDTLAGLSPVERLTDRVDILSSLKVSYPVFGEFISTVSEAFIEPAFQALKELATQHVLHVKLQEPGKSLAELLRELAASTARRADLDWAPYSAAWAGNMAMSLANTKTGINQVEAEVQSEVNREYSPEVQRLARQIDLEVDRFTRVADAVATAFDIRRSRSDHQQL